MNKKIVYVGFVAVLMLVTASFVSVVGTNLENNKAKESPLYKIRTTKRVGDKLGNILDSIRSKFLGERMFSSPFGYFINRIPRLINNKWSYSAMECMSWGYKDTTCPVCI